jgi:hypothetical protein
VRTLWPVSAIPTSAGALRWTARTQAATRHGELPHRGAEGGSETGDSAGAGGKTICTGGGTRGHGYRQMTIPRLTGEQGSHSRLTSLKIGGFAGHILAHDGPLFNYALGVTAGDWADAPSAIPRFPAVARQGVVHHT